MWSWVEHRGQNLGKICTNFNRHFCNWMTRVNRWWSLCKPVLTPVEFRTSSHTFFPLLFPQTFCLILPSHLNKRSHDFFLSIFPDNFLFNAYLHCSRFGQTGIWWSHHPISSKGSLANNSNLTEILYTFTVPYKIFNHKLLETSCFKSKSKIESPIFGMFGR